MGNLGEWMLLIDMKMHSFEGAPASPCRMDARGGNRLPPGARL